MKLCDQVKHHKELSKKIEALEAERKALGLLILEQMPDKTLEVPGFIVRCNRKLTYKVSIEEARIHDAVKIEEVIDTDKIKALYNSGQHINGVKEFKFISVTEIKAPEVPHLVSNLTIEHLNTLLQ